MPDDLLQSVDQIDQPTIESAAPEIAPALDDAPITAADVVRDALAEKPTLSRDETGKFIRTTQEKPAEDVQKEAAKPLADQETKDQAKPIVKDDDIHKMPDGIGESAQARFQKLSSAVKERDEQVTQYQAALQELTSTFQAHGVDDKVLPDLLTYSKAVTSGDTKSWGEMLRNQVRNFELATGQPFATINPLSAHQDIAEALQRGEITQAYARQLADLRESQTRISQAQQTHVQAQQSEQQSQKAIDQGVNQVAELCKNWAATDLEWGKKQASVVAFAQEIAGNEQINPLTYGALISSYYKNLPRQQAAAAPTSQNISPIRPSASSAGPAVARTANDAVRMAIFGQ